MLPFCAHAAAQVPLEQLPLQHSLLAVQEPPFDWQVQVLVLMGQSPLQHSPSEEQGLPDARHVAQVPLDWPAGISQIRRKLVDSSAQH